MKLDKLKYVKIKCLLKPISTYMPHAFASDSGLKEGNF
jgi:hypothetical protein